MASLLLFGLGMVTARNDWPAWRRINEIEGIVKSLYQTGKILPYPTYFQRSPATPAKRYTVQDRAAVAPGTLAITRLDAGTQSYVIELIDADGAVLHTWPIDYSRIVADSDEWLAPHGTKVMPDGSVMVSFDSGTALARVDACGATLWVRTDSTYHHVIEPGDDGFWTWSAQGGDTGQNQAMFRFDAETGDTLESIDLIDDVIAFDPANALAVGIPAGFEFNRDAPENEVADIFHPNDVEPLSAAMAGAFPQFKAGDLLISLRSLDMIAVIDRETSKIIWSMYGPWTLQHDPDWQADGTITVFNNNVGRSRSNIIRVDPKTNKTTEMFAGSGPEFFSFIMGGHQLLPNGNWLILSALEGRVIEVTAEGAPVREYSNILNTDFNAIVLNAEQLPEGYFTTFPACPAG